MPKTLSDLTVVSSGSMTFERRSFEQGEGTQGERLSNDKFDIPAEALSVKVNTDGEEYTGEQLELDEAVKDAHLIAIAGIKRVTLAEVLFAQRMYPPEREKLLKALEKSSRSRLFTGAYLKECGLDVDRNLYLPIRNRQVKFHKFDGKGKYLFSATWAMSYKALTNENNGDKAAS